MTGRASGDIKGIWPVMNLAAKVPKGSSSEDVWGPVSPRVLLTWSNLQNGRTVRQKLIAAAASVYESVDCGHSRGLVLLQVLVTSNDSRIRLYDLRDLTLTCKYKGCTNNSSQIKASFRFIITARCCIDFKILCPSFQLARCLYKSISV